MLLLMPFLTQVIYPNSSVYVVEIATEDFYVNDDPNGDNTPPMLINAAITYQASGGTIYVEAGTYNESVIVGKSVTILGDKGDLNTPGPGPNAPILDGTSFSNLPGFSISSNVSNVTIEGFEIKNYSGNTNANGISAWGVGINYVNIRYNNIHNIGYSGVLTGNGWGTAPQDLLNNWDVSYNLISNHGAYALDMENIKNSLISKNQISAGTTPEKLGIQLVALGTNTNDIVVSDVIISKNEFINYPDRAITALAYAPDAGASATIKDISIIENIITGSWNGINVWKMGAGTTALNSFVIDDNTITINNSKGSESAISVTDVGGNSTMNGNSITLTGLLGGGGTFFHGVDIKGAGTNNWEIKENNFDGNTVGTASVGIRLRGTIPGTAKIDINYNALTEWINGNTCRCTYCRHIG
jgi:hypothetical protein